MLQLMDDHSMILGFHKRDSGTIARQAGSGDAGEEYAMLTVLYSPTS